MKQKVRGIENVHVWIELNRSNIYTMGFVKKSCRLNERKNR